MIENISKFWFRFEIYIKFFLISLKIWNDDDYDFISQQKSVATIDTSIIKWQQVFSVDIFYLIEAFWQANSHQSIDFVGIYWVERPSTNHQITILQVSIPRTTILTHNLNKRYELIAVSGHPHIIPAHPSAYQSFCACLHIFVHWSYSLRGTSLIQAYSAPYQ